MLINAVFCEQMKPWVQKLRTMGATLPLQTIHKLPHVQNQAQIR